MSDPDKNSPDSTEYVDDFAEAENWKKRERQAAETLYGKKFGERVVVRHTTKDLNFGEGVVDTDWRLTNIDDDGKIIISRESRNGEEERRNIDADEFWKCNFKGSEKIADELKGNIEAAEKFVMPGIVEEGETHKDKAIRESREMLDNFMEGNFESTRNYYEEKLEAKRKGVSAAKASFEEAARRLEPIKNDIEAVKMGSNLKALEMELTRAEEHFAQQNESFQARRAEAKELENIVEILTRKMEESK